MILYDFIDNAAVAIRSQIQQVAEVDYCARRNLKRKRDTLPDVRVRHRGLKC